MAFEFGFFNEYSDSVTKGDPVIAAVAKVITPGIYEGALFQSMGPVSVPITSKTLEIYSRGQTSRDGALGASAWDGSATTGLSVTADAAKGLTVGHVLRIDQEVVIVKSVNRSAGTIEVYGRGAGGTTAAAHNAGAPFKVISFAGSDADLKNVESVNNTTGKYVNYVQTFFETMDWLKHGELVRKGLTEAQAKATLLKEGELRFARLLSRAAVLGVKQNGDNGDKYMSAGLLAQLADTAGGSRQTLSYNANGALSDEKLNAAIREVLNNGGVVDAIWLSPTNKTYANNLCSAIFNPDAAATDKNHVAGGVYANAYDYEGLVIPFKVDNAMPDDVIAVVNSADVKKGWLEGDGMALKDEPAASSREFRKSLQGSCGFVVENVGVNHTYLHGVAGGPAEKVKKVVIQGVGDGVQIPTTTTQITVNADADVPEASADNFGFRVVIGTAWTSGTKIATAKVGEVYASNGTAWVKQ